MKDLGATKTRIRNRLPGECVTIAPPNTVSMLNVLPTTQFLQITNTMHISTYFPEETYVLFLLAKKTKQQTKDGVSGVFNAFQSKQSAMQVACRLTGLIYFQITERDPPRLTPHPTKFDFFPLPITAPLSILFSVAGLLESEAQLGGFII